MKESASFIFETTKGENHARILRHTLQCVVQTAPLYFINDKAPVHNKGFVIKSSIRKLKILSIK
jgi:hypothetical protein